MDYTSSEFFVKLFIFKKSAPWKHRLFYTGFSNNSFHLLVLFLKLTEGFWVIYFLVWFIIHLRVKPSNFVMSVWQPTTNINNIIIRIVISKMCSSCLINIKRWVTFLFMLKLINKHMMLLLKIILTHFLCVFARVIH